MRPVATYVDVGLGHSAMAKQQPEAKDGLRQEVEDSVNHDLGIDARLAGSVGDSPNTERGYVINAEHEAQNNGELTLDKQSTATARTEPSR